MTTSHKDNDDAIKLWKSHRMYRQYRHCHGSYVIVWVMVSAVITLAGVVTAVACFM